MISYKSYLTKFFIKILDLSISRLKSASSEGIVIHSINTGNFFFSEKEF